ncbi:Unknown protein, partial [Striga hermonthica]
LMDQYGHSYAESSSRGYPDNYQEKMYSYGGPPYPCPSYSNPYFYDGYSPFQEYGPSHSYPTSQGDYDYYTPTNYETPHYKPSSTDYHQEVSTSTRKILASLLSIIDEFHNWKIIPILSDLKAKLTKFDSTVISFLDLDTSHIPLGRYEYLSAKVCRESARLEGEFQYMVDKFASFKEMGLTLVYDGTQSLDASVDINDLYVRRFQSYDDTGFQSVLDTSTLPFGDCALSSISTLPFGDCALSSISIDESECMDSKADTVHGMRDNSVEDTLVQSSLERARDDDCEEEVVHGVKDEVEEDVESLCEAIDPKCKCALMNDPTHDVEYEVVPMSFGWSFRVIEDGEHLEKFSAYMHMLPTPKIIEHTSEMALVMTGMDSTCSTDMFIIPEVEYGALVRKEISFLLMGVDIHARFHKNTATRVYFACLYSLLPMGLLLE